MRAKITGLITLSSLLLLGGCSSQPTMGERMQDASAESAALAKRWHEGEALVAQGRELVEDGKDRVEDGEEMIEDGNDKIDAGKRLIEKGRDAIARGEREQRDGAEMLRRGEATMEQVERAYAETYPEQYRQITAKD